MQRYRICVTVDVGRIAEVVAAALKDNSGFDPKLTIASALTDEPLVNVTFGEPRPAGPDFRPSAPDRSHNKTPEEILTTALKKGPMRWKHLATIIEAAGYSQSTVNNFLARGRDNGTLKRIDKEWTLAE